MLGFLTWAGINFALPNSQHQRQSIPGAIMPSWLFSWRLLKKTTGHSSAQVLRATRSCAGDLAVYSTAKLR